MNIWIGRIRWYVLLFLGLLSGLHAVTGQNTAITEETIPVKTYPYSDPNPLPSMAVNSMVSPFYPWFVFDGYSDRALTKNWRVITLENDYISLSILPEVGGKVWGATEKSTGREFIYRNHVLKFRAIGIRGPWTSGGIEHNFGLDLGHAPWTSSAVDYITKAGKDGSVTCTVGGFDPASRTQWRVSIILPKDKAYFVTQSIWYNPSPLHDAYLSWENAGFKATRDLQFYFPGTYYIGHDGAVNPWPVDANGRDLSLYSENNFGTSKSYHVSGLFTNWFGGYWHDDEFGFGHYAPYSDAPGKKIWIWSQARDGAIWEDLLTDSDGQYIEAQSGVKFNQASRESGFNSPFDQLSIRPYYTETKTEYWFPVKETKGIVEASPAGTLNIMRSGDSLHIRFCANSVINDSLKVVSREKAVYSAFVRLNPMQVFRKVIPFAAGDSQPVRVILGNKLLVYTSDINEYRTLRPAKSAHQDFSSAEFLYNLAEDEKAMRNYDKALEYYLACLKKEPDHGRALPAVAELYYRMAEYNEALKFASRALENDTYDGSANFISGVIHRKLGNLAQAEEFFSVAARTMEYRSGSFLEIAVIRMKNQDFINALAFAKKSLDYNRLNIPAHELLVTANRKLGRSQEAVNTANVLLETDPLNHHARFELYLSHPDEANLESFRSGIRNELPYESYLELALGYVNLGLTGEAIRVLEKSPPYPVVYYWLSYLHRNSNPEKSRSYLASAEEMSPFLVFPYRLETIPVLGWAGDQHENWKTTYYLGLIYWNIHRIDKARELFEQCGDAPDYAPFYIARAELFQNAQTPYCYPCNDYNRAVRLNPSEWRTWHYLTGFLQAERSFQLQLENAKKAYDRFPDNPVIGIDLAKALLNLQKYKECIKILNRVNILPQEGAQEGHVIYETAKLGMAVDYMDQGKFREALQAVYEAGKWPENLGAGMPYEPDTRFGDYVSAYCYSRIGDQKMSDSCFNRILDYSRAHWGNSGDPIQTDVAVRVFRKKEKQHEADLYMSKWRTEQDSLYNWKISPGTVSPHMQWLFARFENDGNKSAELESRILAGGIDNRFRLFLRTMTIINQKENEKKLQKNP